MNRRPCVQVISLGTHVVCAEIPKPLSLMEVMPTLLAKRHFPPLDTARQLVPGYRDSPDPSNEMAIVYIKAGPRRPCCCPQHAVQLPGNAVVITFQHVQVDCLAVRQPWGTWIFLARPATGKAVSPV